MQKLTKVAVSIASNAQAKGLPEDLLAVLLPIILQSLTSVIDGCLTRTQDPLAVLTALSGDGIVSRMYRRQAILDAARESGTKLNYSQLSALSESLREEAEADPEGVLSGVEEFRLDFSVFN